MSNVSVDKQKLDILANAISAKSGEPVTMTLGEMVEAVDGIDVGIHPAGNINITHSGTTNVTEYATATVPEGEMFATVDSGYTTESGVRKWWYYGIARIDANDGDGVPGFIENETQVGGTVQKLNAIAKNTSITPTESSQTIGGANTMMEGAVTVKGIPSNYVGSGITQRSSSDLTVSGATVTAPAGYYSEAASKSVSSMTLPTSASASASSGYTSKATIGRSTSDQYINIPTGYNSAGAYYKVSAVANGSVTAPSSISGSSATLTTGTNTLTLTKTVSVTPNVTTAGYISSGTAGNSSVSLTASVNTRSSSDLTASGDTVTVPAGYYSSQATKAVASASLGGAAVTRSKSGGYYITRFEWPDFTAGYLSSHEPVATSQALQNETVTPSTVSQTITPTGSAYLESVTVEAMPSGTAGTPTATKGSVSNHSISVTPSATNTTGYIIGGTITGTAVTVSASELVSGNLEITENGTNIDVTNYSTVSVDVSGQAAITVTETVDEYGGIVKNIEAVDISSDTVTADKLAYGITAHDKRGNLITGSMTKDKTPWIRPAEWPNYDLLHLRENQTEAMFCTFDNRVPPTAIGVYANTGGSTAAYQYYADKVRINSDGTITELERNLMQSNSPYQTTLTSDDGDFVCIRVTPAGDRHITAVAINKTSDANNDSRVAQPLLERYSYLPYCTNMCWGDGYGYRSWSNNNMVSDTILGTAATVSQFDGYYMSYNLENLNLDYFSNNVPIYSNMFRDCFRLQYINASHFKVVSSSDLRWTFNNCSNLRELDLSSWDFTGVTNISTMFEGCRSLKTLKLPGGNWSSVTQFNAFRYCSNLEEVDFPASFTAGFSANCFGDCWLLKRLILRADSVVPIAATSALPAANINNARRYMRIYVPEDLIDDYKGASNWSAYYSSAGFEIFVPIEGSPYEIEEEEE